jgi:dienelactone hydrolase
MASESMVRLQMYPRRGNNVRLVVATLMGIVLLLSKGRGMESIAEPTGMIEVHPFQTVTLTTQQFLTGVQAGIPETITGVLYLPLQAQGRFPAVSLLHGAGGIDGNASRWVRTLNGLGVAAFLIDSFTGRGIPARHSPDYADGRTMIVDAYCSLTYLAQHPHIHPMRIAVMGFSRGGGAALYASLKRFQCLHAPGGLEFAAYIAFYPPCSITFRDDEEVSDRPIRLLHGTADDWTPIAPCHESVTRLQRRGKDVQLLAYLGAPHGFDMPWPRQRFPAYQGLGTCRLEEREEGRIVNRETGQRVQPTDAGPTQGVTAGADPQAYAAAVQAVTAFLTDTFKRP